MVKFIATHVVTAGDKSQCRELCFQMPRFTRINGKEMLQSEYQRILQH